MTTLPNVPENLQNLPVLKQFLDALRVAIINDIGSGGGGGGGGGDIRSDGTVPFAADESMGGHKLTNVATPTAGTDAANKNYVDAGDAATLTAAETYSDTHDKYAPDRIVDPSGHGTDLTLTAALTALASTGGTIYVKAGVYNVASTFTLPLQNITIIGAGSNVVGVQDDPSATTFNLGSNGISLFTTPTGGGGSTFASYKFIGFKVVGASFTGQAFITLPVSAMASAIECEDLHIASIVTVVSLNGQDADVAFRNCTLAPTTVNASFWNSTGSGGELTWDHVQASLPTGFNTPSAIAGGPTWNVEYSYIGIVTDIATMIVQDVTWTGFFLGNLGDKFEITINAGPSTITACNIQGATIHVNTSLFFCTNSYITGSKDGLSSQFILNGSGGIGNMTVSGSIFDGTNATSGIDVVNITGVDISGCRFSSHSAQGVSASGSSTLSVSGCRFSETVPVNELASTVVGRYTGNNGFAGSTIIGTDSVVECVRRKDVVGGTTTNAFVTQFTHVNDKGLTGGGSIKNTGISNTLTIRITATDVYGTTDTVVANVLPGAAATWSMLDAVGTALCPFVSYAVAVESTTPGSPTTFTLHHASAGAY